MVKTSTDDSQGHTGTGGGPDIAAGAQAQHSGSFGGVIAALVSWFVLITGTNTVSVSATAHGAQVTGGATAVNTTGAPCRPAGSAFSDQMLVPSELQFVFKTGTDNIYGHRDAQIAGGAGAIYTTGALAQFSRTAASAFSHKMLIQREFVLESGTDRARASSIVFNAKNITFGPGAQIAGDGAVIADGAAAVNTKNAAAVNIYEKRSSNIYCSTFVVEPTSLMIGVGLGITVCSSNKLGARVVVNRKVRWWAARLIKKIKDEL